MRPIAREVTNRLLTDSPKLAIEPIIVKAGAGVGNRKFHRSNPNSIVPSIGCMKSQPKDALNYCKRQNEI